jgi:HK97 family phage prohead protease
MPKPKNGESKEEFLDRCMGDDTMIEEYPEEDQRYAVCNSQWDKEKEKKDIRPSGLEHRIFELDDIEVRSGDEEEKPKIRGHAAVFEKLSDDLGGFREKIAAGAFSKTIKKDDVRALFNHDPNYILGRNKAGTLTLEEDEKGLYFEIDPPDTQYGRDLQVSIDRGDITQCSFAFEVDGKKGEEWDMQEGKTPIRTLNALKLYDISPVTYPAYPQTDVKVRSAFKAAGLDYESLTAVIRKQSEGGELNEAERTAAREAVEKLNSYLKSENGKPGDPGSGGVTRDAGRQAIWNWKMKIASVK